MTDPVETLDAVDAGEKSESSDLDAAGIALRPVGAACVARSSAHHSIAAFGSERDTSRELRQLLERAADWVAEAPAVGRVVRLDVTAAAADASTWRGQTESAINAVRIGEEPPAAGPSAAKHSRLVRVLSGLGGGLLGGLLLWSLLRHVTVLDDVAGSRPSIFVWTVAALTATVAAFPSACKRLWLAVDYQVFDLHGRARADLAAADVRSVKRAELSDRARRWLASAEAKLAAVAHADTQLLHAQISLGAWQAETDDRDLAISDCNRVADELAVIATHMSETGDHIQWEPADSRLPLAGVLDAGNTLSLMTSELGVLAHPLDETVRLGGARIARLNSAAMLPKLLNTVEDFEVRQPGTVSFAEVGVGIRRRYAALEQKALERHIFLTGATGSGKSTMLEALIIGWARNGGGSLLLIDPHGQATDHLLTRLLCEVPERAADIVVLDPGNAEFSLGLNPLDVRSAAEVEAAKEALEALFAAELNLSAGKETRAQPLVMAAAAALLDVNQRLLAENRCNLMHLRQFFVDAAFRAAIMERTLDEDALAAFGPTGLFTRMKESDQVSTIGPIINRLAKLSRQDSFARIFSAPTNTVDVPALLAANKLVLLKMARFSGERKLGEFLVSSMLPKVLAQAEQFGRVESSETHEQRGRPAMIVLDEANAVLRSDELATLWEDGHAELRKYGVSLITATQYLAQLPAQTQRALLQNAGSKLTGINDPSGVSALAESMAAKTPGVKPAQIAQIIGGLDPHVFLAEVLANEDGQLQSSGAFTVHTVRPPDLSSAVEAIRPLRDEILARSREGAYFPSVEMDERRRNLAEVIVTDLDGSDKRAESVISPAPAQHPTTTQSASPADSWGDWDDFTDGG